MENHQLLNRPLRMYLKGSEMRCAWLVLVVLTGTVSDAAKRNVVLFVTDDQSLDAGCYGNKIIKTPRLDELAGEGTVFDNAFCTTASCSASRSVILTGLHNHANGHYGHQHRYHKFNAYTNIISLPVWLNHAGYRTARCGKYHVAPEHIFQFDQAIPGNSRNGVEMANNCREFLSKDSDKPFFLYICTSDPHRGGGIKDTPLKPNRFGNGPDYPGIEEVTYNPDEVEVHPFLPDTPSCRAELAEYYQSVSRVDQGVGRLIDVLKEVGVYDDTLFIFISDHGIAMPNAKTTVYEGGLRAPCIVRDPYASRKGIHNQAMVSWVDLVPTILDFAQGLEEGGTVKPEILAGLPKPPKGSSVQNSNKIKPGDFHGRSFLGILEDEKPAGWDTIYASHTFHEIQMYYPMRVIRERQYKLIWNIAHPLPFPFASDLWAAPTWQAQYAQGMDAPYGPRTVGQYIQRPEFELYDVKNDPWESENLAGDPKYAKELERLKSRLKTFQGTSGDPWIMKWTYE